MLKGKKIILGVTGSIAAYKIAIFVRLLIKEGAEVQVLLTPCARDFVTPLTLSTLSRKPVLSEPYNRADGSWNSHVDLGNWADLMIIAPASANTIAKMASGITDNLLMATFLAAKCPVFFAPAMDLDMYRHKVTQRNIQTLTELGCNLIRPNEGELASGLCGAGRMEEPEVMLNIIAGFLKKKHDLEGKKVLITAGPTCEAIDPVRCITNHSSGKMGFALAGECALRGAEVMLVSGPVNLQTPAGNITRTDVTSTAEMQHECVKLAPMADIIIMSAAVADYTPAKPSTSKIKKRETNQTLHLVKTPDILAQLGQNRRSKQFIAGFALETEDLEANAIQKMKNKGLDIIVLNSPNVPGAAFGHDTNQVIIFDRNGNKTEYPLRCKAEVASDIINKIVEILPES